MNINNIFSFCNKKILSWRRQASITTMRIAVVGAGPAGLVTLYTIRNRLLEKIPGLDVVAFERGEQIGGEWVLSDKPDTYDDTGSPMNSSMYRGLQTNVPTPITQIHPDFPWPEGSPLFPYREEYLKYICNFATTFNLLRYIEFSKMVTKVKRDNSGTGLIVDVKDLTTGLATSELFDFVFLCTGQHRQPFIPPEHDFSKFNGLVLHYHDLQDPTRFYGKRVVVVGSSYGALDMAYIFAKKAEQLYISCCKNKLFWHAGLNGYAFVKPKIVTAVGDNVTFEDGSSVKADVIIYATGFHQVHPLSPELELDFNKSPCLFPIYKRVVHPSCPSLFFIGKAYNFIIHLFRPQAEFACAIVDRRVVLPTKEEMLRDIEKFYSKWTPELAKMFEYDITTYSPVFELEIEMCNDLARLANCQPMPLFIKQVGYDLFRIIRDDILNYRRYTLVENYKDTSIEKKFVLSSLSQ